MTGVLQDRSDRFAALQDGLGAALSLNEPGSTAEHVLVLLPSFSVGPSMLAHYAERLPALEHRYLLPLVALPRIPGCEFAFVTCRAPERQVLDYYCSLAPEGARASMRARIRVFDVADDGPRPVAAKLLDRPDVIAELRAFIGDRPALIEAWNVTPYEVDVALQLGAPINGTAPHLRPIGRKSAGRRLFREAGVPVPFGYEDLYGVGEVVAAIERLRTERPGVSGVVVKTDDSNAGDGNQVLRFDAETSGADVRAAADAWPDWYLQDLEGGAVVEELVGGTRFTSPSAQLDIRPDGEVRLLATHEQVLGGDNGQVYAGCRFPAEPVYAAQLARHARAAGEQLARLGALGRVSVDFAAASDQDGRWWLSALEVNIRKGGTTHPFAALRHLVPGRYDPDIGAWIGDAGGVRCYESTDNLHDPAWTGRPARDVLDRIAAAGLGFDPQRRTGVVLHMLSGLAIDGRMGLTAIGESAQHAAALFTAATECICR